MPAKKPTKRKPRVRKLKPRPVYGFHIPARVRDFKIDHLIAEESPYEDPGLTTRKDKNDGT